MKLLKNIAFAAGLLCFRGNLYAGPASVKLSSLADSLIKGYLQKPEAAKATLAVFQFNCDDKLEKRRVGFAVSELMSHRFVADGTFTVVERGEIGKLLSEQKLQASGAVDSDTAVRLGKLAGAKILLLGNIQKVDGSYQVNARLVDAETSAVIVSAYEELQAEAFEDDAKPYLSLVPEEQALGIYFLYNKRSNSNSLAPGIYDGTYTMTPKAFTLAMIGAGVRYSPTAKLTADVSYMRSGDGAAATNATYSFRGILNVEALRAKLELRLNNSSKLAYYAGAGAVLYTLHICGKTMYYTPMASFRVEYRPQARIGISLAGNYDFHNEPAKPWGIKGALLDKFSLEPTLSVYF